MSKSVGIDLGTTFSVIAVADGTKARVLDSSEQQPKVASVVGLQKHRDGSSELLIGDTAWDNFPRAARETIISIKRLMGRGVADSEVQKTREHYQYEVAQPSDGTKDSVCVKLDGKEYSPIEISAMILKKLKKDAEFRLGEEVEYAVITVPAYFSQIQCDATRKAGLVAGLKVLTILPEPTAAAIAFGMETGGDSEVKKLLVYDLGGGTFDISILLWSEAGLAPLNLEGDMWLGGDNFDQVLIDHALRYVQKEYQVDATKDSKFMAALRMAARKAKEGLSSMPRTDLIVNNMLRDNQGEYVDVVVEIKRAEFDQMIRPLVDRTVELVKKALRNADLTVEDIDHVLMAGGSTGLPQVQKAMEDMFGASKILRKLHPKTIVAAGAAIQAARLDRMICQAPDAEDPKRACGHPNTPEAVKCARCGAVLVLDETGTSAPAPVVGDIAPFDYGIQSAGDQFNVFIKKGDPMPTPESAVVTLPFATRIPNQHILCIPLYGGDHKEKASLNGREGQAFALLPPGVPKGAVIRMRMRMDANRVLQLSAHLEDGTDLHPWVLQGTADQNAVEALMEVEKSLAKAEEAMTAVEFQNVEKTRNQAFEDLRAGRYHEAREMAQQIQKRIEDAKSVPVTGEEQQAENAAHFLEFVVREFNWAFEANLAYRITKLAEELHKAVASKNPVTISQKMTELNQIPIPQVVFLILTARQAIETRIRPVDPVQAESLAEELRDAEQLCRTNLVLGAMKLKTISDKAAEAAKQADSRRPGGAKCPECGAAITDGRHCKNGHDSWIPTGIKGTSGGK